jgi:hypothetical protein
MKKIAYFFALAAVSSLVIFTGCKKDSDSEPEPEPNSCNSQTFPATTGTATVRILNFTNTSGGFTNISASAGDVVALAIEVTKGTDRPQKIRIYQTDCANAKGDIVTFTGQPGLEDGGKRIDLRNTDDPQIRNVNYTVPSGFSTYYVNIEVDESGDKYTYHRIKLTISGSGIVDTWSNITLGGNSNPAASRMSSGTGQTYLACNAAENMEYIDITYAVSTTNSNSYICSNPARFVAPISLTVSSVNCGEDGYKNTNGGNPTYFKLHTANDFATIDDAGLTALTVSNSNPQYIQVTSTTTNNVFEFLNSNGKKGLIKVNSGILNNAGETINVDVKVQR